MDGSWMDRMTQEIRDEIVRGVILRVLIQHRLDWVAFQTLRILVQRGQGFALEASELKFHLAYLADSTHRYVESKPRRAGRSGPEWAFVRATAKAVDLRDGRIAPDPGVAF